MNTYKIQVFDYSSLLSYPLPGPESELTNMKGHTIIR